MRHEIKESEFAKLNYILRSMRVPVIHETIDWALDENNELTMRFTGSAFAFIAVQHLKVGRRWNWWWRRSTNCS